MATTSDATRIAVVFESTAGTTPTSPCEWEILRLTSESITRTANAVESGELNDARGVTEMIQAGASVGGDLNNYIVYCETDIQLVLAVLGVAVTWPSPTSQAVTGPGTALSTFTLEKTFQNVSGLQSYQRYKGLSISRLEMNYSPNEPLTWSYGCLGGDLVLAEDSSVSGDAQVTGSTYDGPDPDIDTADPMRSDQVTLTWGLASLNTSDHTALSITIDSQNREIDRIGSFDADIALGKLMVQITATAIFGNNAPATSWLAGTDTTLTVTMQDTPGNIYTLNFPRVTIDQATVVTPGANTDIVYELQCSALINIGGNQLNFTAAVAT